MPVDYYPNKSVEELGALLVAVQDRKANGGIVSVNGAGVGASREFSKIKAAEEEIKDILYSLHLKDPANYPTSPFSGRITRTRARFDPNAL